MDDDEPDCRPGEERPPGDRGPAGRNLAGLTRGLTRTWCRGSIPSPRVVPVPGWCLGLLPLSKLTSLELVPQKACASLLLSPSPESDFG